MIIVSPTPHIPNSTRAGFDHVGSWNHKGLWIPNHPSAVAIGPSGLRRKMNASVAATAGTIVGTK